MEPLTKKRKTITTAETGPGPSGIGVQPPHNLSLELIVRVASFASTAGRAEENDLQNICVAVGRREVGVLRRTYLFKNMGYLERCLIGYLSSPIDNKRVVARRKMRSNLLAWMEVNADNWKRLCTKENIEQFAVTSTPDRLALINPVVIFNNPAVAIELGLVDVLKHLVEGMHVDIKAGKWNCYRYIAKFHLLTLAMRCYSADPNDYYIKECFEYLLTIAAVDVHADVATVDNNTSVSLITSTISMKTVTSDCLAILVRHNSFDPNRPCDPDVGVLPPLIVSFSVVGLSQEEMPSKSEIIKKVKILLEAGADPTLADARNRSPMGFLKYMMSRCEEGSEKHDIFVDLIALVEEHIRSRELSD